MQYFAAVVDEAEIRSTCYAPPYQILASYHYFKKKADLLRECVHKQYDVLIDSGAFSAKNAGANIDIDDYCKFIQKTEATKYAALDVIGDAKATRFNTEYMIKEYGLRPIPTFHMGSQIEDLEAIMYDHSYIALGGLVFASGIENHCDKVWSHILKNNPKLRVHGFGLTNIELMSRYPWYSVDSSSFKGCKRFGRQQILWNGFNWKTFPEEEYIEHLKGMGFDIPDTTNMSKEEKASANKKKWFLYDMFSSQSYKLYGAHLKEVNKIKDFSYLTAQTGMFD